MSDKPNGSDFEHALAELEKLVEDLEKGELPLEQSLSQFERGIALTRTCQRALQNAEQKVRVLAETDGEQTLTPFEPEEN
ncbi:MAG: exodeoxyribonuclease VII small subunit [Pseudomonadota bacterium]|nr:exodeoxyribonuclease VII small subunit [Pseudomonadota bacterium]